MKANVTTIKEGALRFVATVILVPFILAFDLYWLIFVPFYLVATVLSGSDPIKTILLKKQKGKRKNNLNKLSSDLSRPLDDGSCNHLEGMVLPQVPLTSTSGVQVDVSKWMGFVVLYCYPIMDRLGKGLPQNWDDIPGAYGCTPRSCSFRDKHTELTELRAAVFGMSSQSPTAIQEAKKRLHLPYEVLSDENLEFLQALDLPNFQINNVTYIKRLTLICKNSIIRKVFYPVFPPDKNVDDVIDWLKKANA